MNRVTAAHLGWLLGACAALPAQPLPADQGFVKFKYTGEKLGDFLGSSLAAMGDLDGDSVPDFAMGAIEYPNIEEASGRVMLVSGKTGEVIRTLRTIEGRDFGRHIANGGDLDGDAVNDLIVEGVYFVEIRSGRTGDFIDVIKDRTFNPLGVGVASVTDVNGDRVPDFTIANTDPEDSDFGRLHVHSGASRSILWTRISDRRRDGFGSSVVPFADMDDDGLPEILIGAPGSEYNRVPRGVLHVLQGSNGEEIDRISGEMDGDGFAGKVTTLSDIDGDRIQEIVVSTSGHPARGFMNGGRVQVLSGATRILLWEQSGQDFERSSFLSWFTGDGFGVEIANVGDADGDRSDDLVVWSPRRIGPDDDPRISLLSGRTGAIVATYEREWLVDGFGGVLSGLGDIDGDGRAEFLAGAPDYSQADDVSQGTPWIPFLGRVYVLSYRPAEKSFIRGDADIDGDVDMTDAIVILEHLFHGKRGGCEDGMDVDRTLRVNVTDALIVLVYFFHAGYAPMSPFPGCGRYESFSARLPCERSSCE